MDVVVFIYMIAEREYKGTIRYNTSGWTDQQRLAALEAGGKIVYADGYFSIEVTPPDFCVFFRDMAANLEPKADSVTVVPVAGSQELLAPVGARLNPEATLTAVDSDAAAPMLHAPSAETPLRRLLPLRATIANFFAGRGLTPGRQT